jgi:hypothetical protein
MPLALASGLVTDFDERRIYSALAEIVDWRVVLLHDRRF